MSSKPMPGENHPCPVNLCQVRNRLHPEDQYQCETAHAMETYAKQETTHFMQAYTR